MSEPQTTTPNPEQEPIIPPSVLLIIAAAALLLAVGVAFTQPEFGVVGFGAIGVSLISLVVWAMMNPEDLMNLVSGRAVAFGGTAILVSVLVIVAAVVIYMVVDSANLFADLTEREIYSLNEEVGDVITALGQDPTSPQVRIIGFYDVNQAAARDREEVLLSEMAGLSNGKLSYEFIDLNRAPLAAEEYADSTTGAPVSAGQYVVVPIDPATGEPNPELAQVINPQTALDLQYDLTNAFISATASGDFRAYYLNLPGTVDFEDTSNEGASALPAELEETYGWQVDLINPLSITGDDPQVVLNDPVADGEVVVIAGGSEPLPEDVFSRLSTYLANGGDLVLLGNPGDPNNVPLIAAEQLSTYLFETYGVRVNNDIVYDDVTRVQGYFLLLLTNYGAHPITQGLNPVPGGAGAAIFAAHSIDIADTLPAGVTVTPIVSSSDRAYPLTDISLATEPNPNDLLPAEGVERGTQVVAVAIEDTNTGARIVIGSSDWAYNIYANAMPSVHNYELLRRSIFWASNYEDFTSVLANITPLENVSEFEQPLTITAERARLLGFVSLLVLPFGILGIGIGQWALRRRNR